MIARTISVAVALTLSLAWSGQAARQMEYLGRGVVVVNQGEGRVFVSWRWLATDPDDIAFNVYRSADGGAPVKLNQAPITAVTCFAETNAALNLKTSYFVRPVIGSREQQDSPSFIFPSNALARPYLAVPLQLPPGYTANDASVGDLDGDGEYEIVLKSEQRPRDTASTGLTGQTILQGYKLDGTLLWTINLGRNIREGAHYTQFMVYDLDGDGIAEIACKTADGTIDGKSKVIGDANADWRETNSSSRTFGRILKGPEYFTIFDGRTGAALVTTNYITTLGRWPSR